MLFLLGCLGFALQVFLHGTALMLLWGWFVTPFGLTELTMAHALGLGCTVSYFTQTPTDDKEFPVLLILGILRALLAITLGWIIHLFL